MTSSDVETQAPATSAVPSTSETAGLAQLVEAVLGGDLPVRVACYDGSQAGPVDAAATVTVRSPDLLRRLVTAPGELGLSRGYVAGELDVDGDVYGALRLRERPVSVRRLSTGQCWGCYGCCPPPACGRCRPRRRRPGYVAAVIPGPGTPPRSPITTTCRTPSTGWSWVRR